ncbi:MAG: hypothetical protein JSU70_14030 [Phycisphaerales bacterium]|nr:MAG: hypothetical protein JSU70_14030 [Phycisphaerales bacterium]
MWRKLLFLALVIGIASSAQAANIIWVSDRYDELVDQIPDDKGWVDMLEAQGHTVDYQEGASFGNGYWRTLDDDKIAALNAADLVIISRNSDSGNYNNGSEPTQWSSVTTPLILTTAYISRNNRWFWLNSASLAEDGGTPTLEAVNPHHPIFKDVALDTENQVDVFDQSVGSGTVSFPSVIDVGNGELVAKAADQGWLFIAEWEAGVEFYTGSGQIPAGKRLFFAAGTREGAGFGRGEYNLNAEGEKMFLNAVDYMLGILVKEPWVKAWQPSPADGADDVISPLLQWTAGETAALHDVYFGTDRDAVAAADTTDATGIYIGRQGWTVYYHSAGVTGGVTYYWRVDEVEAAGTVHTGDVWSFMAAPLKAYKPNPLDGALWVDPTGLLLTWTRGSTAGSHDVYFGTDQAAVAAGTGGTSKGNTLAASYDPGALAMSTTYYWRIDEIDTGGSTKHEGDVWSFTTMGVGGGIRGQYYRNTDLSGVPALDRMDEQIDFNWGDGSPDPTLQAGNFSVRWVGELEVAFSETYTFYVNTDDGARLWVNDVLVIGVWTNRRAATEAKGTIDLIGGQKYPLVMEYYDSGSPAVAQLLWESPSTPKDLIPQGALSPPMRASGASPGNGTTGVTETPTLRWTAGEDAAQHDIYFGTDKAAVADADTTTPGVYRGRRALAVTSYVPTEAPLEWDTTYYWRIDEVNGLDIWEGGVWSFTTADYVIVDDFEDYNDFSPDRIFQTWIDGFGYTDPPPGRLGNGTGSTVGYLAAPFAEQTTIHGGLQSMPFGYNNTAFPFYSEAEREFLVAQNFTRKGVKSLALYVYGDPCNVPSAMYVGLQDSVGTRIDVPLTDTSVVQASDWYEWNIELADFAPVTLSSVKKMYIGVGSRLSPTVGGTGELFIDDIRLYRPRCVASLLKPDADLNGNCVVDYPDVEVVAADWLVSEVPDSPWDGTLTSSDIGVPLAGSYGFDGTTYTITGNGHDIWDDADNFHYAYRQISGDCQMTVRVKSVQEVHAWTKAGVMIRDTLDADSNNAFIALTGGEGGGGTFQWRSDVDPNSNSSRTLTDVSPPACVRLVREGDTFTGYIFLDGRWQQEGQPATVEMTDPVYIGLAVTSHTDGVLATATFDRECTFSLAELSADGVIDFKDYAVLADGWLDEQLWPAQ